jgi:hypothetical protein
MLSKELRSFFSSETINNHLFFNIVETKQLNCAAGTNRWTIEASEYAAGFYLVNLVADGQVYLGKLEIQ